MIHAPDSDILAHIEGVDPPDVARTVDMAEQAHWMAARHQLAQAIPWLLHRLGGEEGGQPLAPAAVDRVLDAIVPRHTLFDGLPGRPYPGFEGIKRVLLDVDDVPLLPVTAAYPLILRATGSSEEAGTDAWTDDEGEHYEDDDSTVSESCFALLGRRVALFVALTQDKESRDPFGAHGELEIFLSGNDDAMQQLVRQYCKHLEVHVNGAVGEGDDEAAHVEEQLEALFGARYRSPAPVSRPRP